MADPSAPFKAGRNFVHQYGTGLSEGGEHVVYTKVRKYNADGIRTWVGPETTFPSGNSNSAWNGYKPTVYTKDNAGLGDTETVWLTEGELAVDVLHDLVPEGVVLATVANLTLSDAFVEMVVGRTVVIFADTGSAGQNKATKVADAIAEVATVTLVPLDEVMQGDNFGLDDFYAEHARDPSDINGWGGGLSTEGQELLDGLLNRKPHQVKQEQTEPAQGAPPGLEHDIISTTTVRGSTTFSMRDLDIVVTLPFDSRGHTAADVVVVRRSDSQELASRVDMHLQPSDLAMKLADEVHAATANKRKAGPDLKLSIMNAFRHAREEFDEWSLAVKRFTADDIKSAEIRWLVDGFVLLDEPTVLYAGKGEYKSYIALVTVLAVVTGRELLGFKPTTTGKVAWLAWEAGSDEFTTRMKVLCGIFGIDYEDEVEGNIVWVGVGSSLSVVRRKLIERIDDDIVYWVVDALSGATGGALIGAEDIAKAFSTFRQLGGAVLVLHHIPGRDEGASVENRDPYGSVYVKNSSRAVWGAKAKGPKEKATYTEVEVEVYLHDANNAAKGETFSLVFEWNHDGSLAVGRKGRTAKAASTKRGKHRNSVKDKILYAVAREVEPIKTMAALNDLKGFRSTKKGTLESAISYLRNKGNHIEEGWPLELTVDGENLAKKNLWLLEVDDDESDGGMEEVDQLLAGEGR